MSILLNKHKYVNMYNLRPIYLVLFAQGGSTVVSADVSFLWDSLCELSLMSVDLFIGN